MRSKITHFKGFSIIQGEVQVMLDMSRFEEQYRRAQYQLDGAIMNSMEPFMPKITGSFINVTRAASAAAQGSGQAYAAYGPQGRYLYEGKVMVDELTGSTWARNGARKVLVSQYAGQTKAKEDITYTTQAHPKAQAHWFDVAKKKDGKTWIRNVKKTAGGGRRG
ncbi:MAG: hypothetical protein ACLSX5_13970 [Lachnospiraceae bacterium]